ncbi:phosphatase PAP2 family protein [Helicobacter mehlei]|nr:phosphatase PAP2 family protein [Helicobacter mehlei]
MMTTRDKDNMGYQEIAGGVGIPKWDKFLWTLGGVLFLLLALEAVCVKQNSLWVRNLDAFVIELVRSHPPVPASVPEASHAFYFQAIKALTFFAQSQLVIAMALLVALFYAFQKRYVFGLWFVLSVSSGEIALKSFKEWIARTRPPTNGELYLAHGFSYPSGHALAASLFYGLLLLLVSLGNLNSVLKWGLCSVLFLWVCLMAYTRVYLGVHYPTDVLGGILMGMAWACWSVGVYTKWFKKI